MPNTLDGQSDYWGGTDRPPSSYKDGEGPQGLKDWLLLRAVPPAEWVGLAVLRLSGQDVPSQERGHVQLPPSGMGWGAAISRKSAGCSQSKLRIVVFKERDQALLSGQS